MKRVFRLFLTLFFALSITFSATVKADDNTVPNANTKDSIILVNGITLDKKDEVLQVGNTLKLNAVILPENAANKQIIWTTSDANTASVDSNGLVTALQKGNAIITATTVDGSKTAACTITVNAAKGWIMVNGKWYYYDKVTGIKRTAWLNDNGIWYYLLPSGEMKTGWQSDNGKWYYLYGNGAMAKGWIQYSGQWYYLNPMGDMAAGWIYKGSKWYYLYPSGAMATGWIQSSGTWYCLYKNGEMASKTGLEAEFNSAGLSSGTKYFITIDSTNQMVNIFSGYNNHWNLIRSMRCASGAPDTPTVKGLYAVQGRGYMFRAASNTICKFFTGFYGNYLFHTVLLDNNGNIQDPTLGVPASHGCVRLAIEDAQYIYYNIPNGTRVWSY